MRMGKSTLFFGGVPTAREVDLLMNAVVAEPGTSVAYGELSELCGEPVGTNRFKTIVSAWRRRVFRESGMLTKAEGGVVYFLTADAAQAEEIKHVNRIGRATGRHVRHVAAIRSEDLTTDERRAKHLLMVREGAALLEAVRSSARKIAEPSPKNAAALRLAKG